MKDPNAAPYFHGKVTREQAEDMLTRSGCVEGSFLLRQSADNNYAVSICHNGKVLHYNVERQSDDGSFQIPKGRRFPGPIELVEHHAEHLDGFLTLAQHALMRPRGETPVVYQPGLTHHDLEEAILFRAAELGLQGSVLEAVLRNPSDRQRLLHEALHDLHRRQAWYHDVLYREEAEKRLAKSGHLDGRFLVRFKHEDESYVLTVSVNGEAKHYRIESRDDGKLCIEGGKAFDSLIEMIDHYHIRQEGLLCKLKSAVECPGYKRTSRRATLPAGTTAATVASNSREHSPHMFTPTLATVAASKPPRLTPLQRSATASEPETPPLIQLEDWPAVEALRTSSAPPAVQPPQPVSDVSTLTALGGALSEPTVAPPLPSSAFASVPPSASSAAAAAMLQQHHNRAPTLPQAQAAGHFNLMHQFNSTLHLTTVSDFPVTARSATIHGTFPSLPPPAPQPWALGLTAAGGPVPPQHHQIQQAALRSANMSTMSSLNNDVNINCTNIFSSKAPPSSMMAPLLPPVVSCSTASGALPSAVADMNAAIAAATASAFSPLLANFVPPPRPCNIQTQVSLNTLSQTQHILDISPESLMTSHIVEAPWEEPDQSEDSGSQNSGLGLGMAFGTSSSSSSCTTTTTMSVPNTCAASLGATSDLTASASEEDTQCIYDALPLGEGTFNIRVEQLRLKDRLGGGNFGQVIKAIYRADGGREVPVAVKTLKEGQGDHAQKEILMEARTMSRLRHCNIVRLLGVCKADKVMLVLELAPLGPIHKYLKKHPETPVPCLTELLYQVCQGMAYLELQKFVHRDLAARNVLLVNKHYAKISDFGMSKALGFDNDYYKAESAGKWPLKWYAPECIYKFKFDSKSDVWSFGVTLWEVFSFGDRPYRDLRGVDIIQMLERGERLSQPMWCPDLVYQYMRRCWEYAPERRPSFNELVRLFHQLPRQSQS